MNWSWLFAALRPSEVVCCCLPRSGGMQSVEVIIHCWYLSVWWRLLFCRGAGPCRDMRLSSVTQTHNMSYEPVFLLLVAHVTRHPCGWGVLTRVSVLWVDRRRAGSWGLGADMGGESCYPCHSSHSWATHGDWEHVWWHPTWRGGMHHWRLQYVEEGLVWASAIWVTICQTLAWLWLMTRAGKSHYQTRLHAAMLLTWSSHDPDVLCLRPLHSLGGARCQSAQRWKQLSICDAP